MHENVQLLRFQREFLRAAMSPGVEAGVPIRPTIPALPCRS